MCEKNLIIEQCTGVGPLPPIAGDQVKSEI